MKIKLIAGDHEWSLEGTHVCDERGIAKVLEQEAEIDIDDDIGLKIISIIEYGRMARGLLPDGSAPPPEQKDQENVLEQAQEQIEQAEELRPILQAIKPRKKKEV